MPKNNEEPYPDRNGRVSSLGPVIDLEQHVPRDWWKDIFDSLYLKTDGDVVNDSGITKSEVEHFLSILNPSNDDKILDLCCGQGRHSLELARKGFKNIEGLDRSHSLIQKAKNSSKKEGLNIKFREGDARKLPYSADEFNFVMILGNSFGYFETKEDDLKVLKEVFRILKPGGKILLDVTDGDFLILNFEPRSWEWIGKKEFVARERSLSSDRQKLISREVITNTEKGVIADQFYAERLYNQENLQRLLEGAGFSAFVFHGSLSPDSKRNQDLGMMKSRIIITAEASKQWAPRKTRKYPETKTVAVILGDPSKWDPVKGNFDDDDFETIEELKKALAKIQDEGYKFVYLSNHDNLLDELKRLNGRMSYIFNLCDEGYDNDPTKELHVPALLEWMKIPYTGAGPQCLAHCYDKSLIRGIATEMKIPVSEAFLVKSGDRTVEIPEGKFPVIVKPNFGDSSFGITQKSVAYNSEQLLNAISDIRDKYGYEKPILVEELLTGKDLTIGIIGNLPSNYEIIGITEDDYSDLPHELPKICGYEAKWDPSSPYWNIKTIPADLTQEQKDMIINSSLKLFERLECRDYARFDWRLDSNGNPKLLEANPNPGWCWDGHLAKMSKFKGTDYSNMLLKILRAAEQRYNGSLLNIQKERLISVA